MRNSLLFESAGPPRFAAAWVLVLRPRNRDALGDLGWTRISLASLRGVAETRLIDRRRAAAYVGVTAGRFEQLVRANVGPSPVMVDNKRRWPIALLDVAKDSCRKQHAVPAIAATVAIVAEARPL